MSISQVNPQPLNVRALAALRQNATTPAPNPAGAGVRQPDSVSLSDSARELSRARATVGEASDVREDRVAALKAAVANGTYSVDSRALAQSMLRAGTLK